ncbi:MAG: arylsulfatase [Rhodospirillaceae bacterium]|nr:arylsulfatase [Rhodospirillaceae bacterium]
MPVTRRDVIAGIGTTIVGGQSSEGNARSSTAPAPPVAPPLVDSQDSHALNIVCIVLDDVGFADLGCYGSEVATPALDELAAQGLRYTNFHATALCAPTRAALLTGRNAHAVDVGTIAEFGTARPGYRGFLPAGTPTLADRLRVRGFATYAIGKWHLTPLADVNAAGPFIHWPTQHGFDKWYGFHGPLADHWYPELFENTSETFPRDVANYHLSIDLTDRALAYLADHVVAAPRRPFFLYVAFGACHWPLHVPRHLIDRYAGRYDSGWDRIRTERFERQLNLGVLPPGTQLSSRNLGVPSWDSLARDERRFAARCQEVYAAFLEHTDSQIGRILGSLDELGLAESTLVIMLSDNGASSEGARIGMSDVRRNHYIEPEPTSDLLSALDLLGSEHTFTAYPQGWAQVSNTPLKWYKAKTFGGGIRTPMIVRGPRSLIPAGEIRRQFHHVIDIAPTLIGLVDRRDPLSTAWERREAFDGISMAYTIADAHAPTRKELQHFATGGDRALWSGGWKAVALHEPGRAVEDDPWQLFDLEADFAEIHDLALREPERLAAMKARWDAEAAANNVLPLDDRTTENFANNVATPKSEYVFIPFVTRLDRLSAPPIDRWSHEINAEFELFSERATGVILASGTALAGYEFFLDRGLLTYVYAYSRDQHHVLQVRQALPRGRHSAGLRFEKIGSLAGRATLFVAGAAQNSVMIPRMWPLYATAAGVRCGENRTAPISRMYERPGRFQGHLREVRVALTLT